MSDAPGRTPPQIPRTSGQPHFQRFLLEGRQRRLERAKAKGATAEKLMSRPVITVGQEAPVVEAARLLHKHLVKQLPVVDPLGRLVGIASRSDLLRVFLRPDREIHQEIVEGRLGFHVDDVLSLPHAFSRQLL